MSESIDAEVTQFIEKLLELGGRASNAALRSKTAWTKDQYFDVRQRCLAAGLIGLGRGRGGFVILTDSAQSQPTASSTTAYDGGTDQEDEGELAYYEKLIPTIRTDWIQSEGFDASVVEITASKRVKGSGRWTVPDIVIIGKTVRQYVPGFEFAVHSIEVKRFEATNALAVFEALNHRRSTHYSYLLIVNYPKKATEKQNEQFGKIRQLCEEHGIGLILVRKGDEGFYDNWEFSLYPQWNEPEPYNLDAFVRQYLSDGGKDAVAKMVR